MKFFLLPLCFIAILVSGCGDSGPIEITEVREFDLSHDFETPTLAESSMQRFRYRTVDDSTPTSPGRKALEWTTPEGWKEVSTTSMREANLRFGPNDEGECYVTRLSGMAGGIVDNVNRWRKQMGVDPLSKEEIDALPKKTLLGQPAVLVSVDGAYSGMGGAPKEDSRLHGLISNAGGSMITVKMTGPKALVSENEAKFDSFCESLQLK